MTVGDRRRLQDGLAVGKKAREALSHPVVWPPSLDDPQESAAAALSMAQANATAAVVEMPFYRDGLYSRADALIPLGDGRYVLQETKSSTFPLRKDKQSTGDPTLHHVEDVAIQLWASQESGLDIERAELNLIDNQWRYPGDKNYSGLLKTLDVTSAAVVIVTDVAGWVTSAKDILLGDMPEASIGQHCSDPHDCPFQTHCKSMESVQQAHPVELLPDSAGKRLAQKLRGEGYRSLIDVPLDKLPGKAADLYERIQLAHKTGSGVREQGSETILASLPYPRYFLDFEGIDLPIPRWKGVRPYEQVPFQWSCHIEHSPNSFGYKEFLNTSGDDPSLACIDALLACIDTEGTGPIFVYSATYESTILKGLATRHAEHSARLSGYIDRLVDLLPIVKNHYYHPSMRGSFSIKKVIAAMCPHLNYAELDQVQDGASAQVAYLTAAFDEPSQQLKNELRAQLQAYCRRDTWSMVVVAHCLEGRPEPAENQRC